MSKTAIINSGRNFFIKQLSDRETIVLDQFIFANISGVNGNTDVNLNGSMPSVNQIVHKAPVTQVGLINERTVVYSVVLDTLVGDFTFNYIGLVNSATNKLCMVMHIDPTRKIKTSGQQQGNTITESIWLEMDNASTSTGITVNAETWQIDFSKRLTAEDESIRLTNLDIYGRFAIKDGLSITKSGNNCTITAGLVYIAGFRVNHAVSKTLSVSNGQSIYIDAWIEGTVTGAWSVNYNILVGTNLNDYKTGITQHFVECIASVDSSGNLTKIVGKNVLTTADLDSSLNSISENKAATPKAIYDIAKSTLPLSGGKITGDITIGGNVEIKSGQSKKSNILKTTQNGSFVFLNSNETKSEQKIAYNSVDNTIYFTNIKNVAINNQPVIKMGDAGIGAVGAAFTNNNFDKVAVDGCGFYNLGENSSGTFPYNFSKLCSIINIPRSSAQDKKCSQIIIDTISNRAALRTASNTDFKQWSEIITTDNFNEHLPVGIPQPWPTSTPPTGWLKCNGATFDKSLYPKLAIAYPSGKLPDLRAEFIRGYDDGRGVDSGRVILSSQSQQVVAHKHVSGWGENIASASALNRERSAPFGATSEKGVWCGASGGDYDNPLFYTNDATNGSITTSAGKTEWTDLNAIGLVGTENRPRNIAFLYIVKAE